MLTRIILLSVILFVTGCSSHQKQNTPFIDKLALSVKNGGFEMEDYWVWGASVIKGEDGKYHMFASRWPKKYPFFIGYIFNSEVVRAVSDNPGGPFKFQEVVLKPRANEYWDGRMTHNPTIHKYGDTYLLFYIGTTFEGEKPTPEMLVQPLSDEMVEFERKTYGSIRIGLVTSNSIFGPWERSDEPILKPRIGKWDNNITTNPAPCVADDGSILLVYRSNVPEKGTRLGVAKADKLGEPFKRIRDTYMKFHVEDPYIWWVNDHYEMIAKDQSGKLTEEYQAGVHATSIDGINWIVSKPPKAYSRNIIWDDGTTINFGSFERPQLLIENGKPVCLYCATGDGPGGFRNANRTWNVATPFKK
ncbi:MAG: glycoside hydrolase family protein [Draconibacterium sp.]|nr:glycoside hydrolase family protein [Draconibacterium sp.]